jgi:hypothetical protein
MFYLCFKSYYNELGSKSIKLGVFVILRISHSLFIVLLKKKGLWFMKKMFFWSHDCSLLLDCEILPNKKTSLFVGATLINVVFYFYF